MPLETGSSGSFTSNLADRLRGVTAAPLVPVREQLADQFQKTTNKIDGLAAVLQSTGLKSFRAVDGITDQVEVLVNELREGRRNAEQTDQLLRTLTHALKASGEVKNASADQEKLLAKFNDATKELAGLTREVVSAKHQRAHNVIRAVADKKGLGDYFHAATAPMPAGSSRAANLARIAASHRGYGDIYDALFAPQLQGKTPQGPRQSAPAPRPPSAATPTPGSPLTPSSRPAPARPVVPAGAIGPLPADSALLQTQQDLIKTTDRLTQSVNLLDATLKGSAREKALDAVKDRQAQYAADAKTHEADFKGSAAAGPTTPGQPNKVREAVHGAATDAITDLLKSGVEMALEGVVGKDAAKMAAKTVSSPLKKGVGKGLELAKKIPHKGKLGAIAGLGAAGYGAYEYFTGHHDAAPQQGEPNADHAPTPGHAGATAAGAAVAGATVAGGTAAAKSIFSRPATINPPNAAALADSVKGAADAATSSALGGAKVRIPSAAAKTAGKALGKALGPLSLVLEVLDAWEKLQNLYGMRATGEITQTEFDTEFYAILASGIGGVGGTAILGAVGAAGGTMIGGPVGTAVGAVGGIGLGLLGGIAGNSAGDTAARIIMSHINGSSGVPHPAGPATPSTPATPAAQPTPLEARAAGGPIKAGQTYLVDEKGPELLTAGTDGHITPNNKLNKGSVTTSHYTVNGEPVDEATYKAASADFDRKREAMDARRREMGRAFDTPLQTAPRIQPSSPQFIEKDGPTANPAAREAVPLLNQSLRHIEDLLTKIEKNTRDLKKGGASGGAGGGQPQAPNGGPGSEAAQRGNAQGGGGSEAPGNTPRADRGPGGSSNNFLPPGARSHFVPRTRPGANPQLTAPDNPVQGGGGRRTPGYGPQGAPTPDGAPRAGAADASPMPGSPGVDSNASIHNGAVARKGPNAQVSDALERAAKDTGVDPRILWAKGSVESGYNATAKARGSSATGLGQIIDDTWDEIARMPQAARYGITRGDRSQRNDPYKSAVGSILYSQKNIAALKKSGHLTDEMLKQNPGLYYLPHNLGPNGAKRFLEGMKRNPDGAVSGALKGKEIRNNPSIYTKKERVLSYKEALQGIESGPFGQGFRLREKMGREGKLSPVGTGETQGAPGATPSQPGTQPTTGNQAGNVNPSNRTAATGPQAGASDVPGRINELRKQGLISNQECVALAKAYVGLPSGTGQAPTSDWRKGDAAQDGTLKPGTPVATFMDRMGRDSNKYDGGQGTGISARKAAAINGQGGTTHAAVFQDYERDRNGKITGMRVQEQYDGSGGTREKVYPFNNGKFGTKNGSNYHAIKSAQTGGYLGGDRNPMTGVQGTPGQPTTTGSVPQTAAQAGAAAKAAGQPTPQTPTDPKGLPEAGKPRAPAFDLNGAKAGPTSDADAGKFLPKTGGPKTSFGDPTKAPGAGVEMPKATSKENFEERFNNAAPVAAPKTPGSSSFDLNGAKAAPATEGDAGKFLPKLGTGNTFGDPTAPNQGVDQLPKSTPSEPLSPGARQGDGGAKITNNVDGSASVELPEISVQSDAVEPKTIGGGGAGNNTGPAVGDSTPTVRPRAADVQQPESVSSDVQGAKAADATAGSGGLGGGAGGGAGGGGGGGNCCDCCGGGGSGGGGGMGGMGGSGGGDNSFMGGGDPISAMIAMMQTTLFQT